MVESIINTLKAKHTCERMFDNINATSNMAKDLVNKI